MPVFWLVLVTSAIATPLHVGNFPSLEACQQAAFSSQQTMRDAPGNTNFQLVCVKANTGKAGDPDPPD
jgi:hypothetical protein